MPNPFRRSGARLGPVVSPRLLGFVLLAVFFVGLAAYALV